MSKILKRPMFRKGGPAMSGIMSGIKPRQKYAEAGDVESYREEFMDAYGSVPRGGAFDPLTQLLIGFGQQAMTEPSSGNVLRDLVKASKDPSKQFFKAKSKEAADKRNVQLAATKFGLTEAGKDRRQQKAIDFQKEKLGDIGDAKIEARTETYFKTYGDQKKASNHAKFDYGIQEKMVEKFGADQVEIGEDLTSISEKAKLTKNKNKKYYNIQDGTIVIPQPNNKAKIISVSELETFDPSTIKDISISEKPERISPLPTEGKENIFDVYGADPFDTGI